MFYQCCYHSHCSLVFFFQKTKFSAHSLNSQRVLACLWIVFSEQRFSLRIIFLDCFDAFFFFFPRFHWWKKREIIGTIQGTIFLKNQCCTEQDQFSSVAQLYLTLWAHGLQHARLPCPSPTPGAYSNSCPLSQWCHPTISIILYLVCGLLVLLLLEVHRLTFWYVMNYTIISIVLLVWYYLWWRKSKKY